MLDFVSQFGTITLKGGCLFPKGYNGCFGSVSSGYFVGENVGYGRLEESWREDSSYDFL